MNNTSFDETSQSVQLPLGTASELQRQIGGDHYKSLAIQPITFIEQNNLPFSEGNVVKLVTRHRKKGKAEDIKKAIHYLHLILERDYPEQAAEL